MNKNIIINGKEITIPQAPYNQQNANAILLSGHVLHTLDLYSDSGIQNLNTEPQHHEEILKQVSQAEDFLFLGINAIGEIISASSPDNLEDTTLSNVGYLLSTTTNLLQEIQLIKNRLIHSIKKDEAQK